MKSPEPPHTDEDDDRPTATTVVRVEDEVGLASRVDVAVTLGAGVGAIG